jgi:hypothetical protein
VDIEQTATSKPAKVLDNTTATHMVLLTFFGSEIPNNSLSDQLVLSSQVAFGSESPAKSGG